MSPSCYQVVTMSRLFDLSQAQPLRPLDELLEETAHLTGIPFEHLEAQLRELNSPVYRFQEQLLVTPEVVEPLIDRWYDQIKAKLKRDLTAPTLSSTSSTAFTTPHADTVEETGVASSSADAEAELNPAASPNETISQAESVTLALPGGYTQQITNRYGLTLEKLLPQDETERQAYLQAMAAETEAGQQYLHRVAQAMHKKYKGRIGQSTAYQGLRKKAQEMLKYLG